MENRVNSIYEVEILIGEDQSDKLKLVFYSQKNKYFF